MSNKTLPAMTLELLTPLPVTSRSMFGGYGLTWRVRSPGLRLRQLYFRRNEQSREAYHALGLLAFQPKDRPRGLRTVGRNFEVPPEVLADATLLKQWATRAAAAKR